MQAIIQPSTATPMRWAGRVLGAIAVLFLLLDSILKLMQLTPAVKATTKLGYSENLLFGLGALELICLIIYVIPRTSLVGAVLLTGYLGGAVATHVRSGSDLFSVLFPIILGALVWGSLVLRDKRLRFLLTSPNFHREQ